MSTGSILTNGRRSASPDRRVRFGNIERYDIMMSNEILNNKPQNGGYQNGSFPMTKLDNQIKQALKIGFKFTSGDVTTYTDVVDFLIEFEIITDKRIVSERQITNILQSIFNKIIVRHSAVHSIVFVNLENRSDDMIKEELVRVTTEPVLKSYLEKASAEAHAWIRAMRGENNAMPINIEEEDEELKKIDEVNEKSHIPLEEKEKVDKEFILNDKNAINCDKNDMNKSKNYKISEIPTPVDRENNTAVPRGISKNDISTPSVARDNSIPKNREGCTPTLRENSITRETSNSKISSLSRNHSFSKRQLNGNENFPKRSASVLEITSDSPKKTSNLKRNRSFTKSTDKSFVGSIRNRFSSPTKMVNSERISSPTISRHSKNDTDAFASPYTVRRSKTISSNETCSPYPVRKSKNSDSTKITTPQSARKSLLKPPSTENKSHNNWACGRSNVDIRNKEPFERNINRTRSCSTNDVRDSFNPRASVRKASNSEARPRSANCETNLGKSSKTCDDTEKPVIRRGISNATKASSFNQATIASLNKNNTKYVNGKRITTPDSQRKVKRADSTRSLTSYRSLRIRKNSASSSSETSTPTVSRESSLVSRDNTFPLSRARTNFKSPIEELEEQQQQKDLINIAKTFQSSQNGIKGAKDVIEKFMISIVTEDLEEAIDERLQLESLYQHIRHRMILAKDELFDSKNVSDITVDMSVYFDILFRAMSSNFDRIGCELVPGASKKEKVCQLIHVRLADYVDDLDEITHNETYENSEKSYV